MTDDLKNISDIKVTGYGIMGRNIDNAAREAEIVRPQQLLFEAYMKDVYETKGKFIITSDYTYSRHHINKQAVKEYIDWRLSHPEAVKNCGIDPCSNDNIDETFFTDFSKALTNTFRKRHIQELTYVIEEKNSIDSTRYYVSSKEKMRSILVNEGVLGRPFIEKIVEDPDEHQEETGIYTLYSKAE